MSTRVYPHRVGSMKQSVNNYIRRRGPVQDSTPQRDDNPMSPGLLAFNGLYGGNRNSSGSSRSSGSNNSSRSSSGSNISDRASRIREENRLLSERASVLSEQNKLLLSQKAARVRSDNRTLMMRYNNLTSQNPPPAPPPRNRAPRRSGRNLAVPLQNYQPVNSRRPPPVPPRYNRAPIPPTRTTSLTQRTPQRPLVSNPRRRLNFGGARRQLNLGGETPNFSGVSSVNGDFSTLNGSFGLNNVTPVNLSQYNNLTLPTPSPRRPRQRSNIPFSPQITSTPNRPSNKDANVSSLVTNSLSLTGVSSNSVAMRTNPNISKPVLTNGGGKIDDSEDFEKPRKRARLILPIPFSNNPLTTQNVGGRGSRNLTTVSTARERASVNKKRPQVTRPPTSNSHNDSDDFLPRPNFRRPTTTARTQRAPKAARGKNSIKYTQTQLDEYRSQGRLVEVKGYTRKDGRKVMMYYRIKN